MRRWKEGLQEDKQITCIITYEDKVIQPRKTSIDYELNFKNPANLSNAIFISVEDTKCSYLRNSDNFSVTSSTRKAIDSNDNTRLIPEYSATQFNFNFFNGSTENVWKRRNLENSVNFPCESQHKSN